jgi:hypothetical protein
MNVLIVNFDFPPNDGIGGRRWAKLAKALAAQGHGVWVIKADPLPGKEQSPWTSDLQHPNIHIQSVARAYPLVMQQPVKNVWDKLAYRWAKMQLERSFKGTIYDISLGWSTAMMQALEATCKRNNIHWILATGAPWNMLYDLANKVSTDANLKLLVDFRDPWINARNYGMANLSGQRLAWEKHKQLKVLNEASVVVSPYTHLTAALRAFAPESKANFEVLTHFYDKDDLPVSKPNDHSNEIRIVYGGEMYVECEPQLHWLSKMLTQLRSECVEVYQRLRFDFYSPADRSALFLEHPGVRFHAPIGKKIFLEFQQADGLLLLLTEAKRDDLTTKFFEYLPFHKPLLAMGSNGAVSDFVTTHALGHRWSEELTIVQWCEQLSQLKSYVRKDDLHLENYELEQVALQLTAMIQ